MGLISVGTHPYKIKKQNSKMYYTTFTEPYKYFRKGFYKVKIWEEKVKMSLIGHYFIGVL